MAVRPSSSASSSPHLTLGPVGQPRPAAAPDILESHAATGSDNEPNLLESERTALVQAKAQCLSQLAATLGHFSVEPIDVRTVNRRAFAALCREDLLQRTVAALRAPLHTPQARALRWLRRLLPGATAPLPLPDLRAATFLPGRHEVVLCDDLVPNPNNWADALRVPLAMALLHQRAPKFLGGLVKQWATHQRYLSARARPEMSAELLLCMASRENALARWAWWYGLATLTAEPDLAHGSMDCWAHAMAELTGVPALLARKLVVLHRHDPDMLWRSLREPVMVDALAYGPLDTMVFVPYGQTEVCSQRIYEVERHCKLIDGGLLENFPVTEFAPMRGVVISPRVEPVAAARQLLENGFCPEAVQVLQEALYLNPDNIRGLLTLADLYLQQDCPEAARQCYDRVLELRPGHRRASMGLQRINTEHGRPRPYATVRPDLVKRIPRPRQVLPPLYQEGALPAWPESAP